MSLILLITLLGQSVSGEPWSVTGDIRRVSDPAIIKAGGRILHLLQRTRDSRT